MLRRERSGESRWAEKHGCSPAPTAAASAPRRCTPSSSPPSSTTSTRCVARRCACPHRRASADAGARAVALELESGPEPDPGRIGRRLTLRLRTRLLRRSGSHVMRYSPDAYVVRSARRGDPRAPERSRAAPRRRDRLAGAGAARAGPFRPRLAVDLGRQRRGVLPHRPEPQRRGGTDPARGTPVRHGARLRPLQRLQEAGAPARRHGDPAVLLEICCGRDYVAQRWFSCARQENRPSLRNIFFRLPSVCHGPVSDHKETRSCSRSLCRQAGRKTLAAGYGLNLPGKPRWHVIGEGHRANRVRQATPGGRDREKRRRTAGSVLCIRCDTRRP